jgi:hypothetical protein
MKGNQMSIISTTGHLVLSRYFDMYPELAAHAGVVIAWLDDELADIRGVDFGLEGFNYAAELVAKVGRKADVLITTQPVALPSGEAWQVTLISVKGEPDTIGIRSLSSHLSEATSEPPAEDDIDLLCDYALECINPMHSLSKAAFAA